MTADSPTPKLSFAEKLQAKKQKTEASQKLLRAVSLNKVAQVKELLEKGADPNVLGKIESSYLEMFPLYVAAKGNSNEVLDLLIEHKANLDSMIAVYGTALHGAINSSNEVGVEALLKAGADPNKVNGMGYSPLQMAVQLSDRYLGIVENLLMAEADVNAKTPHGTALDRALETGHRRAALILLDNGANEDLARDSNYSNIQSLKASSN
jgi:ankyrin repeat protein